MQPNGLLTRPLAFVDLETTGLSPSVDRVAEVGVVTADGDRIERWTTLVASADSTRTSSGDWEGAPRFVDIARDLARRLDGRLLLAHNARFDHAFLTSEFERAGVYLQCDVVCTVMLSRKLSPDLARHDLDSLAAAHGLVADIRHRALPDADLLWQWWQSIRRTHKAADIEAAIAALLEGPVLPAELDPAIVAALPSAPGAFVLHGEGDEPLIIRAAANLRAHVVNYFRINRASRKALEHAHRVRNITWRRTRGMVGARLHAAALRTRRTSEWTWRFAPEAVPCITIVPLTEGDESCGRFKSERKARNALARLAEKHRLCHSLAGAASEACRACPVDGTRGGCRGETQRKKQLLRLYPLLRPLRIDAWPHTGPIGLRERSDLHIVDRWRFLGTARTEDDVNALLDARREGFDFDMYRLLSRELAKLPPDKIVAIGQRK
jgi:DNA polymerase III subunit epsilon